MIEVRKYSPGAAVAGLAVSAGTFLGSFVVESHLAMDHEKLVNECQMDASVPSSDYYKYCIKEAENKTDFSLASKFLETAGFIGMLGFGCAALAMAYNPSEVSGHTPDKPCEDAQ